MANFSGGSAWAMAKEVADGYVSVNERTFTRLKRPDLDKLTFELDRKMREIRADQPDLDDGDAVRLRSRRLQRLTAAKTMLLAFRKKRKI